MFAGLVEDLMALDDTEITRRFRELELRRRHDEAELAAVIAVAEARGVWADDGHLTVKGWLRANGNWSNADVACHRKIAKLCNDHPVVGDALLEGHVGLAQVSELAGARANRRCGDEIGHVIDQLVEHAEQLPFEHFRTVVKRWVTLADQDGAHRDAEITNERRTVSLHEMDGGIDLRASGGSPLKTAAVLKIYARFVEAEFQADVAARTELHGDKASASLLPRTDAQRRFDALIKIFETAAAMPADARFPDPVINIVINQERFEHMLHDHGILDEINGPYVDPFADLLTQFCETDNGVTLTDHDVLGAAMNAYIRRIVLDGDGMITDFGRTRRLFNDAARTALKLMIQNCDHVGCDIGAESCQIDHLEEWVRDGGKTDLSNGGLKCGGQNRSKHRLGLTEKRDRYGKTIQFRRDGTPITPVGQRLRLDRKTAESRWWIHDLTMVSA